MIRILPNGLKGATVQVNRKLERTLNELGGVRSPEMRAAGNTLAKSIRKTLSTRAGGQPSAPGQPPRRQTGALAKSVKAAPLGDVVRVGPLRFTASFMEEGVQAVKGETRRSRGRRNRSRVTKKKRSLTIAPRPFMARALEAVKGQLLEVFVREGRKHLERS
ncbi:MAG TPA: hypothetical protein P5319_04470 [Gemmatimonadales bacterium]|nr:hypothetical protein [Gemmatimonadales bacterium]